MSRLENSANKTEVVSLTKSSSCSSLPVENELKPAEAFMLPSDCSWQEEILSVLAEPSPSSEVIPFDWSNLIEYRLHLGVAFEMYVRVTTKSILWTFIDEGAFVSILSSTSWQAIGYPELVLATN